MKSTIKILLTKFVFQKILAIIILLIINTQSTFGQYPQLGRSWSFGVFATVGDINNTGNTVINNDIGTNAGVINVFPSGIMIGATHIADSVTNEVTTDINNLYSYLTNLTCDSVLSVGLGNNQILTPNVYCIGAASTLTDTLILDAQGDSNALFIFQMNGAFISATFSYISLINSAKPCNVFWQVNGLVELGDYTYFNGNMIAAGAITLLDGAELEGRIFSIPGAINLNNNYINIPCYDMFLPENNFVMSAICKNGETIIACSGNFEKTNVYFTLEKSNDNKNWRKIGTISSKNNITFQRFSFEDKQNNSNENTFYRLFEIDYSGNKNTLRVIRKTNNCISSKHNVFSIPNPANNEIAIIFNGDVELIDHVSIVNLLGKKVYHKLLFNNTIDTRDIENGIYLIQIYFDHQLIQSKLIINHN
jgi:hypothetical protein